MLKHIRALLKRLDDWGRPGVGNVHTHQIKEAPQKTEPVEAVTLPSFASLVKNRQTNPLPRAETIEDCIRSYMLAMSGSPEEEQIASRITKLAITFDDWMRVISETAHDSPLGKHAAGRLNSLAKTFEQWELLAIESDKDALLAETSAKCTLQMASTAKYIEDWLKVYERSTDPATREIAVQNICQLAARDDSWDEALEDIPKGDSLHGTALEWRLKEADTIGECESLFDSMPEDCPEELLLQIARKLEASTEPLDDWINAYDDRSTQDLFTDGLLDGILRITTTVDDAISVIESVDESDDSIRSKVYSTISRLPWEQKDWQDFRDRVSDGEDGRDFATSHLLRFATTAPDVLSLYLDALNEWNLADETLDMILTKLASLVTVNEARLIVCLEDEDTPLRRMAEKRITAG